MRQEDFRMPLPDVYQRAIRGIYGKTYVGTWLPANRLKIGQVGTIESGEFKPETTLADLGIGEPQSVPLSGNWILGVNSNNATSITVKLAGQGPLPGSALSTAEAGISVQFAAANAVVVQANECQTWIADKLYQLERDIKNSDRWQPEFWVIIGVVTAKSCTTLISSATNSSVDVVAKVNIPTSQISLGNAGLVSKSEKGLGMSVISDEQSTPLYKAAKVERVFPWIWGSKLRQSYVAAYTKADAFGLDLPAFYATPGWDHMPPDLAIEFANSKKKPVQFVSDKVSLQEVSDLDLFMPRAELMAIRLGKSTTRFR
jgi:hypothetical protein